MNDLPMNAIVSLPETDDKKKVEKVNCLPEVFRELAEERKVSLADITRATGIPTTTLYEWWSGKVDAQKADKNLLRLAQYFKVDLAYLCFGIGTGETEIFGNPGDDVKEQAG